MASKQGFVQGALFEENYLMRTLGDIAHKNDVALTELVANAWDAGASSVEINIPEKKGGVLEVVDNGIGLSKDEFHFRWMRLGYNRLKHQGRMVEFPKGRSGTRVAYGRNGIGRHGLLCFNDNYTVVSFKDGERSTFDISTHSENQPFVVVSEKCEKDTSGRSGIALKVVAGKNLPDPERILQVISARFLHDPNFLVKINGRTVPLEEHSGHIGSEELVISNKIRLRVSFFDTQKAARNSRYQGIALWQSGRLVGEPTWTLGNQAVLDGRTRLAKRYTFIAMTNDLADFVREDWTGFKTCPEMESVFESLTDHVRSSFAKLARENIDETKVTVRNEFKGRYSELSPLGKLEVDETIEHMVDLHPTIGNEAIGFAVEAVINLEKTRSGRNLLQKLSMFSEEDISHLDRLLEQWSIKDALSVLDEIDSRINVIEAIAKLSSDSTIDELKILHPLVTSARWLFGPEYDSQEYTSNQQLRTIAKKIFGHSDAEHDFENMKKRPDLFVLSDSSVSVTGAEQFNDDTELLEHRRILIVELKKGGSELNRDNRDQALHYVEDFIKCGDITGTPRIVAFVVGEKISKNVSGKSDVEERRGTVHTTTYSQLVDTARRRMFNLRQKLEERYSNISGIELAKRQGVLGLEISPANE